MPQISLTFPDGSVRGYDAATTGAALAESISKSLAKKAVAIALDGRLQRLPFEKRRRGVEIVLPSLGQHRALQPAGYGRPPRFHRPFRLRGCRYDQSAVGGQSKFAQGRVAMLVHQRGQHHGGGRCEKPDDFVIGRLTHKVGFYRQMSPHPKN